MVQAVAAKWYQKPLHGFAAWIDTAFIFPWQSRVSLTYNSPNLLNTRETLKSLMINAAKMGIG